MLAALEAVAVVAGATQVAAACHVADDLSHDEPAAASAVRTAGYPDIILPAQLYCAVRISG